MGKLPPETSLDDVLVRIRQSNKNPNIGSVKQVVLKEGPRAFRVATLYEIRNAEGKFHHHSLTLTQVDKTKQSWTATAEKVFRIEKDELNKLHTLLEASRSGQLDAETGDVHIVRQQDFEKYEHIVETFPDLGDEAKTELVVQLLSQLDSEDINANDLVSAFEKTGQETLRNIATASKLVSYKEALQELIKLVEDLSTTEHQLQAHLNANPWMFGSEYSELLSRRTWTRDDSLDYMLRRTADNYLEVVEIKRAFADALFIHDEGRDSYYPSAKLSPVIGQVTRYIEEVDRNRDQIIAKDRIDPLKIRAKVIVGRDGSGEHNAALRNLNSHLYRIEIITFDQLIRIAERVLAIFDEYVPIEIAGSPMVDLDDDIPF